jgi:hypothetical protein
MDTRSLARWAFIIGLVLALLLALVPDIPEALLWVMIVLGVFAGWAFIAEGEAEHNFLLLAVGLFLFQNSFASLPSLGELLTAILTSLAIFFGAMLIAIVVRNIVAWLRVP